MSPTLKQMAWEAVKAHGGRATFAEIKDYVRNHFGEVNETSLNCQVGSSSVNAESRVSYPENHQPRVCRAGHGNDLFFKVGWGEYAIYDPALHGQWEIVAGSATGKDRERWHVRKVGEAPPPAAPPPPPPPRPKLRADELGKLRRWLSDLCDQFDRRLQEEGPSDRINRLVRERKIPRSQGKAMLMVIEFRNRVEYEKTELTAAEAEAVLSAWGVIEEWAASRGYQIKPLPRDWRSLP